VPTFKSFLEKPFTSKDTSCSNISAVIFLIPFLDRDSKVSNNSVFTNLLLPLPKILSKPNFSSLAVTALTVPAKNVFSNSVKFLPASVLFIDSTPPS
jgi:hypothetical protein